MKTLFRVLGAAAAVAATGAAIVVLDKVLNDKGPLHVEEVEFPEEAEKDPAEAAKAAEAYAEGEAKTIAAALQKRLQSQQQAFAGDKAAAGRVVAVGDYWILYILDWPEEGSDDAIEQDLLSYFVASA